MLNYVAGAHPQLPDLRQPLVLARHVVARAPRCSRRAGAPGRRDAGRFATIHGVAGGIAFPLGIGIAVAGRGVPLGALPRTRASASSSQVIGDSPRAARYAGMRTRRKILAVMCHLRRDRRARRREPGRRLRPPARPAQPAAAAVRLHRHRRRGARPLQPVRGRADRVPARRAQERRLRAAGRRLPVRARRRDAGDLSCSARSAASCSSATGSAFARSGRAAGAEAAR